MTILNLTNSYKNSCRLCGTVKKSSVPGNFVCEKCKVFCEQQLSGEELVVRDLEIWDILLGKFSTMQEALLTNAMKLSLSSSEAIFLRVMADLVQFSNKNISNQQYLSVCRILKRKI